MNLFIGTSRLIRIVPCFVFESIVKDYCLAFFPVVRLSVNVNGAQGHVFGNNQRQMTSQDSLIGTAMPAKMRAWFKNGKKGSSDSGNIANCRRGDRTKLAVFVNVFAIKAKDKSFPFVLRNNALLFF
jgi:hypothetical protein